MAIFTRPEQRKRGCVNLGIETTFEMNPGNHFKDADLRLAKGIAWMLK